MLDLSQALKMTIKMILRTWEHSNDDVSWGYYLSSWRHFARPIPYLPDDDGSKCHKHVSNSKEKGSNLNFLNELPFQMGMI